jgi:hypothetical protein
MGRTRGAAELSERQKRSHARTTSGRLRNGTLMAFCGKNGNKSFIFNLTSRLQEPMRRTEHGK